MKRTRDLLLLGACLAVLAYAGFYYVCTASHRSLLNEQLPELAWLKARFDLNEREYARISELHAAYKPRCAEMCRRIDAINAELKELLTKTNRLTAEIQQQLAAASEVRLECQTMMLQHFLEVSRTMPREQGKRYMDWVQRQTFGPAHRMSEMRSEPAHGSQHHP
jgi:hypothetical protein